MGSARRAFAAEVKGFALAGTEERPRKSGDGYGFYRRDAESAEKGRKAPSLRSVRRCAKMEAGEASLAWVVSSLDVAFRRKRRQAVALPTSRGALQDWLAA
jgi:hypothetical protein